jgi:hypothetical protein
VENQNLINLVILKDSVRKFNDNLNFKNKSKMESVPQEEKKHESLDEGDKQPDNTPVVQEVVHA